MTTTKFKNQIFPLLLTSLFFTSCNGQVKTNAETEKKSEQKTVANELPKMLKTQQVYSFMAHNGPHSNTNVSISNIFEDTKGNIWVATMGEGVYRFNGKNFINLTATDGLISNAVFSIMEDKNGSLWFGNTKGVSKYNGKSFTGYPFSVIQGNYPITVLSTNTEVTSMLQDRNENIWLGTTNGVYRYNGRTFTNILELGTLVSKLSSGRSDFIAVRSIIEDKEGNIWFTSWSEGLCRFDGKLITSFKAEGLLNNDGLLQTKNGDIWIGNRGNGLYHYNGKTFEKLFADKAITEMKEDTNGNIWFCAFDRKNNLGEVLLYNPLTNETILRFTTKEKFGNKNVTSIAIDKSGNVWFGTNKMTLSKYDGKTFTTFISE